MTWKQKVVELGDQIGILNVPNVQEVTLAPAASATTVASDLSWTSDTYARVHVEYEATLDGGGTQSGALIVDDDGTNAELEHEFATLGTGPDIAFSLVRASGSLTLKYTLGGSDDVTLRYWSKDGWA